MFSICFVAYCWSSGLRQLAHKLTVFPHFYGGREISFCYNEHRDLPSLILFIVLRHTFTPPDCLVWRAIYLPTYAKTHNILISPPILQLIL